MIKNSILNTVLFLLATVVIAAPAFAGSCCASGGTAVQAPMGCGAQTSERMSRQSMIAMQAKIFLDSPAAILVQIQTLGLSGKQKLKLLEIEKQARQKALAVLTPEQRRKLGDVSAPPVSMASLCQKMCGKMMTGTSKDSQTRTAQQTICPVMEGKINRNIFTAYKGKKVYFCCAGCIGRFKANPEKYLNKLPQFKEAKPAKKAKVVSVGTEQKVCPIMGGSINKAVFTVYKGKKVYFCCPGCKPEFEKNPEKFLAKLPQFKK